MESTASITETGLQLATAGFRIGAIKIQPENPFLWASGTYNPIYNDNRMFLGYPELRKIIINGFADLLFQHASGTKVVAGTSTAGIPHGYGLALDTQLPFCYVREKPKDHGKRNQIEGLPDDGDFSGEEVLLIEDLFSTGGSSVKAVQAIRDANGIIKNCFSIFTYDLPKCKAMFAGTTPFSEDRLLSAPCGTHSLLHYSGLIQVGIDNGHILPKYEETLNDWMDNQATWGENNGFPPVKK